MRDKFDRFEACGVERVGHEEYLAEKKRVGKREVQWDFETCEEADLEPKERFWIEIFISITGSTLCALQFWLMSTKLSAPTSASVATSIRLQGAISQLHYSVR